MADLDEEKLVHELLEYVSDDDTPAPQTPPPARQRPAQQLRLSHSSEGPSPCASAPAAGVGAAHAASKAGSRPAGQAAAAAAALRDSQSSETAQKGGGFGARAAAEAAAAFARGKGGQTPPCTIQPGSSPVPTTESDEDLQRLRDRQRDWAVAVHGSEDAALAAGWKPKDEPDYALYSVYMTRVRECLESPDVEDEASEIGRRLRHMVTAFRAYMACLYAGNTFVMEHRHANLQTLGDLGELTAEMASLSGGDRPSGRESRHAEAGSSPASCGDDAAAPARSRRSESAPVVKRLSDLAVPGSSLGGDGNPRPRRGSLDLERAASDKHRPSAEKLKQAYQDRASMDVRPTIRAIKFTPQQRKDLLQRRQKLDTELERSQAERKTLLARFQTLTAKGSTAVDAGVMDALAALRGNLDAEGRVITDFSAWFTSRLLTPLQHARCNSTCYPYMPDVIGISDMLAAEPGL